MACRLRASGAPVIVHVVNSLEIGGLENGVVNLVNRIGPRFRHVVVCLTTEGALRQRLDSHVEVHTLHKHRGHDVRAFLRLVALLRRIRPRIVHSRNWAAFDAVAAAYMARVPVVIHGEHGREISDPEGQNRRRNGARRLCAPIIDRFVAVSDDLRRWLVERLHIAGSKVTTIHNGVDLGRFSHQDQLESRVTVGIPASAQVIGTVGRLDPVKDQAGLIRAFARLASTRPQAMLVIAGDGPCRGELEALVVALGLERRVRLLGSRSDIPVVLGALDVFALPSIAEGISNTLLEAMATGLPVVATRVGGNPELVEDGRTGILVPVRDESALAAALDGYLDDGHLRTLHGKGARERVVQHFSLERMGHAYTELYTDLLAAAGVS
jgi:sugar transferase (PEP-CTERM/EpsH1 system associated)